MFVDPAGTSVCSAGMCVYSAVVCLFVGMFVNPADTSVYSAGMCVYSAVVCLFCRDVC
jgi:hypothetical protein